MTQVKRSNFDVGKNGVPASQPVSNLNMCHLQLLKNVAIYEK